MKQEKNKRISLQDIAALTGVSKVTVSAALNGMDGVGAEKREEIRKIAMQLGYRPSAAARLLKQKINHDIGLVIFERGELIRGHSFFCDLLFRFQEESARHGINGHFEWVDYRKTPEKIPSLFTNGLVGGLLIAGTPSEFVWNFMKKNLSIPYINLIEEGTYSIQSDGASGIYQAIQYLAAQGHRDIAMINGSREFRVYREADLEFRKALNEFDLEFQSQFCFELPVQRDAVHFRNAAMQTVLRHKHRPTALLLPGDGCKTILYDMACHGVVVPRDLSLIAFATTASDSQGFSPWITSVDESAEEFVVQAVQMLRNVQEGRVVSNPIIRIIPKLNLRETVLNIHAYQNQKEQV